MATQWQLDDSFKLMMVLAMKSMIFVPGPNSEQSTIYHKHIMNNIDYCSEMHLLVRLEGLFRQRHFKNLKSCENIIFFWNESQ